MSGKRKVSWEIDAAVVDAVETAIAKITDHTVRAEVERTVYAFGWESFFHGRITVS